MIRTDSRREREDGGTAVSRLVADALVTADIDRAVAGRRIPGKVVLKPGTEMEDEGCSSLSMATETADRCWSC